MKMMKHLFVNGIIIIIIVKQSLKVVHALLSTIPKNVVKCGVVSFTIIFARPQVVTILNKINVQLTPDRNNINILHVTGIQLNNTVYP